MQTKFKCFVLIFLSGFLFNCFEDVDDIIVPDGNIKDFIWKAMNAVYLYKSEVNDLSNDRFANATEYQDFLNNYEMQEELFEALVYDRQTVDRFSILTSNYFQLEQQLSGLTRSNGAEFNFYSVPGNTTAIFGVVRLVLPNSSASSSGLYRGQVFNKINGVSISNANLSSLLSTNSYSLNIATYNDNNTETFDDDQITDSSEVITLTKQDYSENPIYNYTTIDLNPEKVGYLMYNGFVSEYDSALNQVFAEFQSQNIDELILDLRYNSGGSIRSATLLGSMITGQFNNQVFTTLRYNENLESNNTDFNFTNTINNQLSINSLNLDKLYVLTSNRSASASEMMINSLKSYINVVQIGDSTVGKSQASQFIYDSPNLGRNNANPNHTYAILPLIAITVNKDNEQIPPSGITPTTTLVERPGNYGTIGSPDEPLLEAALADIQGSNRQATAWENQSPILESYFINSLETLMYVEAAD